MGTPGSDPAGTSLDILADATRGSPPALPHTNTQPACCLTTPQRRAPVHLWPPPQTCDPPSPHPNHPTRLRTRLSCAAANVHCGALLWQLRKAVDGLIDVAGVAWSILCSTRTSSEGSRVWQGTCPRPLQVAGGSASAAGRWWAEQGEPTRAVANITCIHRRLALEECPVGAVLGRRGQRHGGTPTRTAPCRDQPYFLVDKSIYDVTDNCPQARLSEHWPSCSACCLAARSGKSELLPHRSPDLPDCNLTSPALKPLLVGLPMTAPFAVFFVVRRTDSLLLPIVSDGELCAQPVAVPRWRRPRCDDAAPACLCAGQVLPHSCSQLCTSGPHALGEQACSGSAQPGPQQPGRGHTLAPQASAHVLEPSYSATRGQAWTSMLCHCAATQVLDVIGTVTPSYADLKEVSLFLTAPNVLPPEMALALYVSIGARGGTASAASGESFGDCVPHTCSFPVRGNSTAASLGVSSRQHRGLASGHACRRALLGRAPHRKKGSPPGPEGEMRTRALGACCLQGGAECLDTDEQ